MRKSIAALLAASMALTSLTVPAQASEGGGEPFITAAHYKKNISLEQFRANPRSYFKSETAFRLIVRYVGDEIWEPDLTAAEFNALMRDEKQTRVRACNVGEKINTGAYLNGQFFWFVRVCRPGEQIVQVLVKGVWKDMFSLNCLNAVEDQTPAPPPALTQAPPPPAVPNRPRGRGATMTTTAGANQQVTSPYIGGVILFDGGGHTTTLRNGSVSTSADKATSTSGSGVCASCNNSGHAPVSDTHIEGK